MKDKNNDPIDKIINHDSQLDEDRDFISKFRIMGIGFVIEVSTFESKNENGFDFVEYGQFHETLLSGRLPLVERDVCIYNLWEIISDLEQAVGHSLSGSKIIIDVE